MEEMTVRRTPGLAQRLRASPASYALAAANVLVFLWVEAHGSSTDPETLVRFGALAPEEVWSGEWWRLLTAAFLHIGFAHLAVNVAFGLGWCVLVEGALGTPRFLALYLLSAIGGSALSLFGQHISAGASGALFGVIGATLALHHRALGSWRAFLASRGARFTLGNIAVFSVIGIWARFDQLAHLGGFLTGAAMASLWSRPAPRRAWPWAAFGAGLLLVLAAALRPDPAFAANRAALRDIHAAVRAEDPARARALVDAARARGLHAPGLDYYEGLALAQQGDLEGALAKLRPLAEHTQRGARDEARRATASVARLLGIRLLSGEGRPPDPERGRALLDEACRDGDAEACRALKELGGGAAR
jgi:rhomboid protease GluP